MRRLTQVVVVAAIKQNGKYLLTKRDDPKNKLVHNTWQMPGGGLEFEETVIQCLHREIMEEVGIKIRIKALIPRIHERIFKKSGWHGVAIGFLCEPTEKRPKITINNEASDFNWFSFEELKKLKLHYGTRALIDYAEKIGVEERT